MHSVLLMHNPFHMTGIKHGKCDTDVNIDVDSPGSPITASPPGENNNVEDSVAMLTLSVPVVTEKSQQDLIDPVPPTVMFCTKKTSEAIKYICIYPSFTVISC